MSLILHWLFSWHLWFTVLIMSIISIIYSRSDGKDLQKYIQRHFGHLLETNGEIPDHLTGHFFYMFERYAFVIFFLAAFAISGIMVLVLTITKIVSWTFFVVYN